MPQRICTVDGCSSRHRSKGLCVKHLWRMENHGSTDPRPKTLPPEERFWSYVDKTSDCWLWTRPPNSNGYGRFCVDYQDYQAHRYAYELAVGPIPEGMEIDHICWTPLCVRPDHLRPVTRKQNAEHMKGPQPNSKSGVRGVSWSKVARKWQVAVKHHQKQHHGGFFDDIAKAEQAAIALRNRLHTHNDADRMVG